MNNCKLGLCFYLFIFSLQGLSQSLDQQLLEAIKQNDLRVVQELVDKGGNINEKDTNEASALMWAVYKGDLKMVKFLNSKGANPNIKGAIYLNPKKTSYYGSLLAVAAGEGKLDVLQFLLEDCKLNIEDKEYDIESKKDIGWTALHWAAFNGKNETINYLINNGANIDAQNEGDSGTPLIYALYNQHYTSAKLLIDAGCNTNLKDSQGRSALHYTSRDGQLELTMLLVKNGAKINMQDSKGWTPLMLAAIYGNEEIYQYLLMQGAEKHLVNSEGKTAELLFRINFKLFETDYNQAIILYNEGKYIESAELFAKWLPVVKEEYEKNETMKYYKLLSWAGTCYRMAELYDLAEPLLKEALEIAKIQLGENHPTYATLLNNLAIFYDDIGNYEKAELLYKQAIEIDKIQLGENHPDYANKLNNLAQLYIATDRYKLAEPLMIQALEVAKLELGENHLSYVIYLNNLAGLYEKMGLYLQAEPLYKQAVEKAKNQYGKTHPQYATYLNNLAGLYQKMGYNEQAEQYYKQALKIDKIQLGEKHSNYIRDLNNLATLYLAIDQYEKAELLMKQVIEIDKIQLGESHPSYATDLNNLAQLYSNMGRYEQAELLMKQAIEIDKIQFGENHTSYATELNNLAQLYQIRGNYQLAEPLFLQAIEIDKFRLSTNHPTYAKDLNNLAQLYVDMGLYVKAEPIFKKALEIDKVQLGENHPNYAIVLNNLANLYVEMGLYQLAEPLMSRVLEISKIQLGENHHQYSIALNNLAQLYADMGRFEKAERLMKQRIEIDKKQLGENHPSYAVALNNLAQLYAEIGRFEQAEPLMKEALRIDKEILGDNHFSYSCDLNNLALLYMDMGIYNCAESLMKQAIEIDKIQLRKNHPRYASTLINLAVIYIEMGSYDQGEPLLKEARRIARESLGENHPVYTLALNNLAILYYGMGHFKQADSLVKEAFSNLKNNLNKNNAYLSEVEENQFLVTFMSDLEIYHSINYEQLDLDNENGGVAMDIELYRKGLLLNSVIETRKRILNSSDTSLINKYQTMITYRKQADKLFSIPKEQRYEDPAILVEKANELEKDLKLRSKENNRSLEEAEITWKQILDKMKPDEAVVEFANFRYYNKDRPDSTLYCALVLRKQDTIPHMVYLFEEKQLAEALPKPENNSDADINNTYTVLRGTQLIPDSSLYKSENLYNLVWKPLDSLLSGIKTINYACSGLLNMVSFAAISDTTGKLLCEKYALNQYSSTRNLAIETTELPITDASIYGGIQFELDTTLMIANSRQYSKSDSIVLAYNSTRSGNKRGNGFDELEGTSEEANAINTLFQEKKIHTSNYTGAGANEESFKAMAEKKSPSVIHLSTHGFYYPDTTTQRKSAPELQLSGSDLNRFQYSPDPLLRSGIVLAGANRVWRGETVPDGVEDGILTAKDVSQLNLSNTQLVVLSACQTGLGDVKGSEGVFGLQRAFKMAGVKYLLMSLWSVPDKETKEFMGKFYTKWLSGIPIRRAFQSTQQEMRVKYPEEPYKWAAFVLVE